MARTRDSSRSSLALVRVRAETTVRRTWRAYLLVALVLGLLLGVGLAAVAGARRTQSSFAVYLAHTDPTNTNAFTALDDPQLGLHTGYAPARNELVGSLPGVRAWADAVIFNANINLLRPKRLRLTTGQSPPTLEGSTNGEFLRLDKVTLVAGRMFRPGHPDDLLVNASALRAFGAHLGSTITVAFYSDAALQSSAPNPPPTKVVTFTVVGVVVYNTDVIQDDIGALGSLETTMTPALTRELAPCCAYVSGVALQIPGGAAAVNRVEREVSRALPQLASIGGGGGAGDFVGQKLAQAARTLRPESTTLYVFGVVAALAALLIASQLLTRLRRTGAADRRVLRALGATRAARALDAALLPVSAVALGAALAVGVAVALSPIAPLGAVRPVYPDRGVAFDAAALLLGAAAAVLVLGGIVVATAAGEDRRARAWRPRSRVATRAAASGLPAPAVEGLRLALDPRGPEGSVPVRAVIASAVAATALLAATLTYGASLDRLVSHPALYGWNWSAAIIGGYTAEEDLPGPNVAADLARDHLVTGWAGVNLADVRVGATTIPVLGVTPGDAVHPPITAGHAVRARNQIVLGADTMAALHAHLGSVIAVSVRRGETRRLTVVGVAVLPAFGNGGGGGDRHMEMASGALLADSLIPLNIRNLQQNPIPGPQAVFLRYRAGTPPAAERADLARLLHLFNTVKGDQGAAGGAVRLLRPAEIVNYRTSTTLPTWLAALTAAGAIGALGLTLASSVRRRRRDLAILRVVGFSRRQLATTVAAQATTVAVIGVAVGVPLGALVGRALWGWFASQVHVVDSPAIPVTTLALVAAAALALANLAAWLPARAAARIPAAVALRAE